MEAMGAASPGRPTCLLAASTYAALGNPGRAAAWRRRADAEGGPGPFQQPAGSARNNVAN